MYDAVLVSRRHMGLMGTECLPHPAVEAKQDKLPPVRPARKTFAKSNWVAHLCWLSSSIIPHFIVPFFRC